MELVWVVQFLLACVVAIGGFLYKDLKAKTEGLQKEFMTYQRYVAEEYATQPQLTRAIDSVIKTVEQMAASLVRIEGRLYDQSLLNHNKQ